MQKPPDVAERRDERDGAAQQSIPGEREAERHYGDEVTGVEQHDAGGSYPSERIDAHQASGGDGLVIGQAAVK